VNAFPREVHEDDAPVVEVIVNKPDWTVRIIAAPPGEAPLWVRQKWVGLDLPVARYSAQGKFQGRFLGLGVLSMPTSWLGQWLAVIRGRAELIAGYTVEALPAFGILGEKSPEAAACVAREHAASDRAETLSDLSRGSLPDRGYLIGMACSRRR
jgi:hypothetical protein